MKYILEDIKLRKVAEGKRNAGSLFIQATVVNPDDEWDEPGSMTTFNERVVKKFAQYLQLSVQEGTDNFGQPAWKPSLPLDANKPIPDNMLIMTHAQFEEVPSPGGIEMVRINDDGTPRVNPKNGQYYRRTSIIVLTKKVVDNETGEIRYARGWSPTEQASGIWSNLYAPASQFDGASQGVILPIGATTPLINGQTAAPATPETPTTPATPTV